MFSLDLMKSGYVRAWFTPLVFVNLDRVSGRLKTSSDNQQMPD